MKKPVILVTGSNGQLGTELGALSGSYPQYGFVLLERKELAIDDEQSVQQAFAEHAPDYLINCAAYTAVDLAETERGAAEAINGKAVGYLAAACERQGTKFIHISTDYVFNGQQKDPLKESDPVDPVNYYGATKLHGEKLAMERHPDSIIIRTSWVYAAHGKNFVRTMIRLMGEKEEINVVGDQYGAPTYAADLAAAIMAIIASGKWKPGIYHYSNAGNITWFDFASEIARQIGTKCIVNPITTDQFPTPAKRPSYSVMDKSKIIATYDLALPHWKKSLEVCLKKLVQ